MMMRYGYLFASIVSLSFSASAVQAQQPDAYAIGVGSAYYNPLATPTVISPSSFLDSTGAVDPDDGVATNIPVGFSFDYMGKTYSSVNVCVNGWISVGAQGIPSKTNNNSTLFTSGGPRNVIAPYWGDHTIGEATEILYQTTAITDPNLNAPPGAQLHTFTVEWRDLIVNTKSDSNSTASFQVVIIESSMANDLTYPDNLVSIEFHYGDFGMMPTVAVGIRDSAGSSFINALVFPDTTQTNALASTWPPTTTSEGLPCRVHQFAPGTAHQPGFPLWAVYGHSIVNAFYNPLASGTQLAADLFKNQSGAIDHDDGVARNIATGFSFDYNGSIFDTLNICVNGWVSLGFQSTPASTSSNAPLFGSGPPTNVLAPYLADHFYRTNETGYRPSSILYTIISVADPNPNAKPFSTIKTFIIEWRDLNINDKTNPNSVGSFQLKLIQNPMANDITSPNQQVTIEFHYGGLKTQPLANVGIKDSLGTRHFNGLFSSAVLNGDSTRSSTSKIAIWPAIAVNSGNSGQALPGKLIQILPQFTEPASDTLPLQLLTDTSLVLNGDSTRYRVHRLDFFNSTSDSLRITNVSLTTQNGRFSVRLVPGLSDTVPPKSTIPMLIDFFGDTVGGIYHDTVALTTENALTSSYVYLTGHSFNIFQGVAPQTILKLTPITLRNCPNPFSDRTTLTVLSTESARASISIVNLLGEEVARLYDGELTAGEHPFVWNATGFPMGTYLGLIRTAGSVYHVPITLLK